MITGNMNMSTILLILLIGILIGGLISNILKKRRYEFRKKKLLKTIEDREEWIKILEQQLPAAH